MKLTKSVSTKKKITAKASTHANAFPVVAIGASAGGLEAISSLLHHLPINTGMAFIYVQHLSPDHKSILTSLLAKVTTMKVQEGKNKMVIEQDNVYVIPPDKELIVKDGKISLTPRRKDPGFLPIDDFFYSIAKKYTRKAIGIVLSGSAYDGTKGLGVIKAAGGLTFAQDESAKFSSMPKSAIASGAVDFVLSPKEMALELARLSKQKIRKNSAGHISKEVEIENNSPDLKTILTILLTETNVNFEQVFHEELQNANEEVVSSNEELQSVNEELETSKEETESTNEELITTNQELQTRNDLLIESYDFSEAIISTIHEPMIILDKDLRVKSANKAFYTNFKVSEAETERTLLFDLGNKQWNIPSLRKLLKDILSNNTQFHDFEVTHTFNGIGKKIMLLNARRIVQKTHGEQLILLAINDITDRTLLQLKEKELLELDISEGKTLSLKLEKAVKDRTAELAEANKTLGEKNNELEKLNSNLEAFAYLSSHDLQEPLRKIQTFASRLLETETQTLSDKGKDYFSRMQKAASRMQQLIEDLLAFSRLSISDRKFETKSLTKIIDDVKAELKEVIEAKHATIDNANLNEVSVIPFQFRQLLYNLLSNALKFSNPIHPLHVQIKSKIITAGKNNAENLVAGVSYCQISVSDNGIGFDDQYKDRIFEVFQKLHGKDEYEGTGIGLAIVKKVVENHNGFISVTSKINKGTIFNIYIPVRQPE